MKAKNRSARGVMIIVFVLRLNLNVWMRDCNVDTSDEKKRVGNTHVKIRNCVQVFCYFHTEHINRKYRKFELYRRQVRSSVTGFRHLPVLPFLLLQALYTLLPLSGIWYERLWDLSACHKLKKIKQQAEFKVKFFF